MAKVNRMNGLEEAWLWAKKVGESLPPQAVAGTVAVGRMWNQCRPKVWGEQSPHQRKLGSPGCWQTDSLQLSCRREAWG